MKKDTCPGPVVWDSASDGTTRTSPRGSVYRGISANRADSGRETPRVRSHLYGNCRKTGDVDSGIGGTRRRGLRGSATPRTRSIRSRRTARRGRPGRRGCMRRRSNARCRRSALSCICRALGQLGRPTPKVTISNWPSFFMVAVLVGHLEEGTPLTWILIIFQIIFECRYTRYKINMSNHL